MATGQNQTIDGIQFEEATLDLEVRCLSGVCAWGWDSWQQLDQGTDPVNGDWQLRAQGRTAIQVKVMRNPDQSVTVELGSTPPLRLSSSRSWGSIDLRRLRIVAQRGRPATIVNMDISAHLGPFEASREERDRHGMSIARQIQAGSLSQDLLVIANSDGISRERGISRDRVMQIGVEAEKVLDKFALKGLSVRLRTSRSFTSGAASEGIMTMAAGTQITINSWGTPDPLPSDVQARFAPPFMIQKGGAALPISAMLVSMRPGLVGRVTRVDVNRAKSEVAATAGVVGGLVGALCGLPGGTIRAMNGAEQGVIAAQRAFIDGPLMSGLGEAIAQKLAPFLQEFRDYKLRSTVAGAS